MRMKRLLTFLTLLTVFIGVGWATDVTYSLGNGKPASWSPGGSTGANSCTTSDGFTIYFSSSNATNANYVGWNSGNTTMTVSHNSNKIESIVATCSNGTTSNVSISDGGGSISSTSTSFTWTKGNTDVSSVSFKLSSGKQLRISQLKITYSSGGSQSNVGAPSISFSSFTAGSTSVTATITPGENATSTSYKIGSNGTYQSYSTPVQIDLTNLASPITVYAKSSDGTNESTEVSTTFTVPALGVSISPSNYSGYAAQQVIITPSNYVGDYAITYTINDGTATDYTAPFTLSDPGTYEIVATINDERAGGTAVISSTATITINEAEGVNLPFVETFAKAAGDGPSGDSWSGSTASGAFKSDNEGWAYNNGYAGDQCARFGKSGTNGYATTPLIKGFTANNEYTLTFKAGAWNGDGTTLSLTASNGTFKDTNGNTITSVTMSNNAWTDYEVIFVPSASTSTITFTSNKNRFFLDEINIVAPLPEGDYYLVGDFNNWTQQDPNYKFTANTDGNFILDGVTIADNSKFKIMKGSAWCGGGTSDSRYNVTSDWHTDMNITVGDAGKDYYMASGGTCYFTISDRFLLTVQKAPVAIRGDHNSWSETAMTATETGWTIDNINLVEGNQFQFIDGWNVYHGGAGAHILVNYLGVPLDMGTSGNYYVTVPGKYTITVNRWLNKMTADVERNTHNITCVATPNGGGSVSATVGGSAATSAKYVDEVTINTTPSNGYTLSDVVVTGNTSSNTITVTDNKFMMPDEDVTITATFVAGSYAITVVSPNGTTTCPATATVGQNVSFTVTPNEGYTVNTVTASFVNNNGGTTPVTVTEANGTYSFGMPPFPVTVTVTYTKQSSGGGDGDYVKVTLDTDLTDGEYLIVYEEGSVAFDGSLEGSSLNSSGNYIDVVINDYTIPSTPTVDAAIFTYDATAGTFLSASGYYIGRESNSNGMDIDNETAYTHTVSIDENGNAVIQGSGNPYLRFNTAFGFRYYKTGQQPVALYKKVESATVKAPVISPEGGTFLNSQYPYGITVTVSPVTEGSTIYVSTDGTNYTPYNAATTLTITETTTVSAYASKNDLTSETVSETYNLVDVILEDVQFSPIPGTYSGAQTLQMYTTNQNAKIYYTTDGSTPSAENGTLYSGEIDLEVGNTYNIKAIAVLGNNSSDVAEGTFIINAASTSNLNSIAELNAADVDQVKTMGNPFQIIYMNTWRHNGTAPEYAYVRDNTGYGLVYFGNGYYNTWSNAVNNPKICEMGDWIPGGVAKGTIQVWSDGFHNELGGKNNATTVTGWPTASDNLQNTPIIPEEMTNANINAGWDVSNTFATEFNAAFLEYCTNNGLDSNNLTDDQKNAANAYAIEQVGGYSAHIQPDNVWGHYVHLRKNTIRVTTETNPANATDATRKKYGGFVTDQSGEDLIYYDGFYNFSGYNGTPDYSDDFFQEIQNNGGTFDVYGIVGFYGPYAADEAHNYIPFEILPIDFLYIYKPLFNIESGTYYDTQTVTLTCATEGATIWYKTSDMEDYAEYTGPITVDATTTIETYSSIPTKYNDVMESVVNTLVINMGDIPQPVISPESGVFTLGEDEPVDATIEFETDPEDVPDGTVIYFTVDGSDPKDENSARYEYTTENVAQYLTDIDETTTVRAIAYYEDVARQKNYYSREAEAKTYTFVKSNGIKYDLVTDQTQLNESSVYVIVNKANNMAVGTTQNENNRSADGVKFVDETTKAQVYGNDELAQFTLKKVGNKWYMQTMNGSATGYLYVGDGNTLLTEATATDAAEATITIDADNEHQAHISFVYNNELTRYLRYYNNGKAFSTYTSETSNLPVSLYYIKATPLANIEKEGVSGQDYTVADELVGVYFDQSHPTLLWCKDQGNVSIAKSDLNRADGEIDFLHEVVDQNKFAAWEDCDQSNWVILDFSGVTGVHNDPEEFLNKYIAPASITGTYTKGTNYKIALKKEPTLNEGSASYTNNVYVATNFVETYQNPGYNGRRVLNPKGTEVHTITYAVWNGSGFSTPDNTDMPGSITVDWTYNANPDIAADLTVNSIYEFTAAVGLASTTPSGVPGLKVKDPIPATGYVLQPLDLTTEKEMDPTTGISGITNGKDVKSVKYVNVAGIVSDVPFQGVNIVVTEYTDGSRTTTKMLKK